MLAAMMLPVVAAPLRHVRDRSFARRRARAMLLFILGYFAVWMAAGVVLQLVGLTALSVLPLPLPWLGVALALGVAWQVSPAKQW
jgi:predicted metal-binding membrane protein